MTQLAEKKTSEIAMFDGFEEESGSGFEEVTSMEDLAIPYLSVLQALSPQCKKSDAKHIEGAEEGLIFNSVMQTISEEVQVVPCFVAKSKVEWNLREEGGGLVNVHPWDIEINTTKDDRGRMITVDGTQIVDTRSFYVLVIGAEGMQPAVINFTSTQMKKARMWTTMAKSLMLDGKNGKFEAPMFAGVYSLSSGEESNKKGSWSGWVINRERVLDPAESVFDRDIFDAAVKLKNDAKEGVVKASMEDPAGSSDDGDDKDF